MQPEEQYFLFPVASSVFLSFTLFLFSAKVNKAAEKENVCVVGARWRAAGASGHNIDFYSTFHFNGGS